MRASKLRRIWKRIYAFHIRDEPPRPWVKDCFVCFKELGSTEGRRMNLREYVCSDACEEEYASRMAW